jgi:HEAT repeat protein
MKSGINNYLSDIIERMCDTSDQAPTVPGYNSSNTVSWNALREAEKLENKDLISDLIKFLDTEKNKNKRDKAYFILGCLAKNTNEHSALNYLINRVSKETDKYIVASMLDRIANIKKPLGTDLQPLINAIKSDKWLIRHSAIQSLNNTTDAVAEESLIEILDNSEDPFDLTYANATLNRIGTPKAIPILEKHLKSRKRDVRESAKFAIEEIKKRYPSL